MQQSCSLLLLRRPSVWMVFITLIRQGGSWMDCLFVCQKKTTYPVFTQFNGKVSGT